MLCKADGPVFVIIYIIGQFITGLTLSSTLGMTTGVPGIFNGHTFIGGLTTSMEWYRIIFIMTGGFCCANSDFLASCACTRLPFAVVVPIFMGWGLVQATILNYIIEKSDANPYFLFSGVVCAFMAICAMSLSDKYATSSESEFSTRLGSQSMSLDGAETRHRDMLQGLLDDNTGTTLGQGHLPRTNHQQQQPKSSKVSPWIYVSLISGIFGGLWPPLQVGGRTGSGAVDNPCVTLFLFHCGELLAIPVMLFYHGRFIVVKENRAKGVAAGQVELISHYVQQAMALPREDKLYGMLAGGTVACGSFLFFTASAVLSSTVAFAICSCAPLVSIAIGVVLFKQLTHASFLQTLFIGVASVLFVLAIALMVCADF
jgi:hypothetical protein